MDAIDQIAKLVEYSEITETMTNLEALSKLLKKNRYLYHIETKNIQDDDIGTILACGYKLRPHVIIDTAPFNILIELDESFYISIADDTKNIITKRFNTAKEVIEFVNNVYNKGNLDEYFGNYPF